MTIPAVHNWPTNAHLIEDVHALGYIEGRVFDATPGDEGLWWKRLVASGKLIIGANLIRNMARHDFQVTPILMLVRHRRFRPAI